ncbi:MAG: alpha/beta hydrolase [Pseudomonadota bacterium]
MTEAAALRRIEAGVLEIAYLESGPADGWPCLLGHGFPYDAHAYDAVAARLARAGARVIVPWLRGYGATRFLDGATMRSGEQAALAADMAALMDALGIGRAVLAGYDWGGRAMCIIAALWPERCAALVTGNGYNIHDVPSSARPASDPALEHMLWYTWYFQNERGRRGLIENRRALTRYLWRIWSPEWPFDDTTFERSAAAFDNPDFVEVVTHSYRVRHGLVPGDPAYAHLETRLVGQPPITVPAISIDGAADGVNPGTAHTNHRFTGPFAHRRWEGAGHNLPQERPDAFADAIQEARAMAGAG